VIAHLHISPTAAQRLVDEWAREHAGYYGRPHGSRSIPATDHPEWMIRRDYGLDPHVWCGHRHDGTKHAWVRCSGTWAALDLADERPVLVVSGARHSVRELIPDYVRQECTWQIVESQRPDLSPWETTT
jgi:hypothetical protein